MINQNDVFLITYPDSLGGDLKKLKTVLDNYCENIFSGIHILPPYPSTGDRGFAPVDYTLIEPRFGTYEDIDELSKKYEIMLDIMVNHVSRHSKYFKDYAKNGEKSEYSDMFLPIKMFWNDEIPLQEDLSKIFLRRKEPYSNYLINGVETNLWTTFGKTNPSEQVDINVFSSSARNMFKESFENFNKHGVKHLRLDAIGYVIKKMGTSCFFVKPDIYNFINEISSLATEYNIQLLPEIHGHYSINQDILDKGIPIYDFILPYLVLQTILLKDTSELATYLKTCPYNQYTTLDCHDGIPVKPDLDDIALPEKIAKVCKLCEDRGSDFSYVLSEEHCKDGVNIHQIRGTFYEVLNRNDHDYLTARAIQLFTPGTPQIYYNGLLAGINDDKAAQETGDGRDKNRHNYSMNELEIEFDKDVVKKILEMINIRRTSNAFGGRLANVCSNKEKMQLKWINKESVAILNIDLEKNETTITLVEKDNIILEMNF